MTLFRAQSRGLAESRNFPELMNVTRGRPRPGKHPQAAAAVEFYRHRLEHRKGYITVAGVPEFRPAGVLLRATISSDMSLSHLSTLKCYRTGPRSNPQPRAHKASAIPSPPPRATIF
ncbi:hypothetical protein ANN_17896 [Periplaneta americana]|uniref:Uncharacterized protein n=1 Tax=Periplaneta americana TaxID=6978 RepID=A0ABQ8SNC9_PERAM|nr:hypothetical protein ANN_17896 [Periplaneta americana]